MISSAYRLKLIENYVQSYVKENGFRPTRDQIAEYLRLAETSFAGIESNGLVSFRTTKPGYMTTSSAEEESDFRSALFDDLEVINSKIKDLDQKLDAAYRSYINTSSRLKSMLSEVEAKADNLLLVNQNIDNFVYGVEETFTSLEYIDLYQSGVAIHDGYCEIGSKYIEKIDPNQLSIQVSNLATGVINVSSSGSIDAIKYIDGQTWNHIVSTKSQYGRVALVITVQLPEQTSLSHLKLYMKSIDRNKRCLITLQASSDGVGFATVGAAERPLLGDQISFPIGLSTVKTLKLFISKDVADKEESGEYLYMFSIDAMELLVNQYNPDYCVLIAGPYEVLDHNGEAYNFTRASLSACVINDPETSVDFYLSTDGETWKSVDYKNSEVVVFDNNNLDNTYEMLDYDLGFNSLTLNVNSGLELNSTEGLLNTYIASDYSSLVNPLHITIERNIQSNDELTIDKAPRGWSYDKSTGTYKTHLFVENQEGLYIDFGPKACWINGHKVSGRAYIPSGYSEFRTQSSNWLTVESQAETLEELKTRDPLYPYNHRYLVEGYGYDSSYIGEKTYRGVDRICGQILSYVAPEEFVSKLGRYDIFTVDKTLGRGYIKVYVNKQLGNWSEELFDIVWKGQLGSGNQLYVKAILNSTSVDKTPIIEDFKVRVI